MTERTAKPRRRQGKARRKVLLVLALGALGLLAGLLGQFGGFGAGGGDGGPTGPPGPEGVPAATNPAPPASTPATQPASRPGPLPVTRPLRITIRGLEYSALGKPVSIPQILELIKKVPDGRGPPIEVIRSGESLPTAENALRKAFESNKIHNAYWPP